MALGMAVLALGAVVPAASAQSTERVSVDSAELQGNGTSVRASISDDGRHVAFVSSASNLVANDTNGIEDVFVRDRDTGVTVRVSVASDATQANGNSEQAAISADGRHVAFVSAATNLVANDTNGVAEVFVHQLDTGITERVGLSSSGTEGNAVSLQPTLSADGRYVAFGSGSTNLVANDTNSASDVFLRDRDSDTTERVSVGGADVEGNNQSRRPSLSADGRVVAFGSSATNLVAGDVNGQGDIFVRDLDAATTTLVSVDSAGTQTNAFSEFLEISGNGRRVVFSSFATNLVANDTNITGDVFVHDLDDATTERVSVSSAGGQAPFGAGDPAISADGRRAGFSSESPLVADDTNTSTDVFVRDLDTATTERVSVSSTGTQGTGFSARPSLNADGGCVAFDSGSSNLVAGDTNGTVDVFVRVGEQPCAPSAVADLRVQKSCEPDDVAPGDEAACTVTVTNDGPAAAENVTVADDLPAELALSSGPVGDGLSCSSQAADPEIACTAASLASGQSASASYAVTVPLTAAPGQGFENVVSVGSDTDDLDPANNTVGEIVRVPDCTIDRRNTRNAQSIDGTSGDDVICGSRFGDVIRGRGGDDLIFGLAGGDGIEGGDGNDVLLGGEGSDGLKGNAGDDTLIGGAGNDTLDGGAGVDTEIQD